MKHLHNSPQLVLSLQIIFWKKIQQISALRKFLVSSESGYYFITGTADIQF